MAFFPPAFLDEVRARVGLADLIGRRTRLVKKGREWSGLCPFHNEKSPSFFVNEEKGFFHCFGCGVHGDQIGFVMQTDNLTFPEAVERLAGEAGLEVPRATPAERQRIERQKGLAEAMEAACDFFQAQLTLSAAAPARAYLQRRGLDEAAIAHFRLGYAPPGQARLKQALERDFPPAMLVEAGLLRQPDDGRPPYDFFRERVMFPIGDRTGRVIAFGGRVLDSGQPKYLNSPDTPLFAKGRVLYGLNWARAAVGRGAEAIVTEGYMDVIALHRAGFEGAMAPLGTALTEDQLEELWRFAAEPVLCFDGDAAGQRAAARALDRALPLLTPGHSLRFATLPAGEDPDSLITRYGKSAMQTVLRSAQPLAETLWRIELAAGPTDTPERRADLAARLNARAETIGSELLKREYQRFFKNCLFERLRSPRITGRGGRPGRGGKIPIPPIHEARPPDMAMLQRRQQEILLAVILRRPQLLDVVIEDLADVEFRAPDLDKLRRAIINSHTCSAGLDADALAHHLSSQGFAPDVETLNSPQIQDHARFALKDDPDLWLAGWREALAFWRDHLTGADERARLIERGAGALDRVADHARALEEEGRLRRQGENESGDGPVLGRR